MPSDINLQELLKPIVSQATTQAVGELTVLVETAIAQAFERIQKEPRYISTSDAAKMLGVSYKTARNWIDKGILTAYKIDGKVLLERNEIQEAIKEKQIKKYKHH